MLPSVEVGSVHIIRFVTLIKEVVEVTFLGLEAVVGIKVITVVAIIVFFADVEVIVEDIAGSPGAEEDREVVLRCGFEIVKAEVILSVEVGTTLSMVRWFVACRISACWE